MELLKEKDFEKAVGELAGVLKMDTDDPGKQKEELKQLLWMLANG